MLKLLLLSGILACGFSYADSGTIHRGAINNLCQNLTAACQAGYESTCKAAEDTGCKCDESMGTCTRGNYSHTQSY